MLRSLPRTWNRRNGHRQQLRELMTLILIVEEGPLTMHELVIPIKHPTDGKVAGTEGNKLCLTFFNVAGLTTKARTLGDKHLW